MDYSDEALELHKKFHGKIELHSKVPLSTKADLSAAYTPGVAKVCTEIARDPALARELTLKRNTIAVVSDGSAILGLGDLGALAAIPVMEGKAALFKEFAGVDAFPICLDTKDTEEIIKAVKQIAPVFGGINLEDIAAPRCFEIERRLQAELDIPVLHDDQHGTAVVVVAALINSLKLKGMRREDAKLVVSGAGAAGHAVADLILQYGFKDVLVLDSKGIISRERTDLDPEKQKLAECTNPENITGDLATALRGADIFVGVSRGGLLSREMVATMAAKPVILALANPVPEIMPEEARAAGAYIVGTGRSDFPNQINNVLAFPGIFRGALDNGVRLITDAMLLSAAQNLADHVQDLSPEKILPDPFDKEVASVVARAIHN